MEVPSTKWSITQSFLVADGAFIQNLKEGSLGCYLKPWEIWLNIWYKNYEHNPSNKETPLVLYNILPFRCVCANACLFRRAMDHFSMSLQLDSPIAREVRRQNWLNGTDGIVGEISNVQPSWRISTIANVLRRPKKLSWRLPVKHWIVIAYAVSCCLLP